MRDNSWNRGFDMVDDHLAILEHEVLPRRIKDNDNFEEVDFEEVKTVDGMYLYVDNNGIDAKVDLHDLLNSDVVHADWEEMNPESMTFIENKPVIGETVVQETFNVSSSVGGYDAGDTIYEGTNWAEVVKQILAGVNDNVQLYWDIRYDEPEAWRIKNFGHGPAGASYFGHRELTRHDLLRDGFTWPGRYTIGYDEKGEYVGAGRHVIAINASARLDVDQLVQEGLRINSREGLEVRESGGWKYFYLSQPSVGVFSCSYSFKEFEPDVTGGVYFGIMPRKPFEVLDLTLLDNYKNVNRLDILDRGIEYETDVEPVDSEGFFLDSEDMFGQYNVLAVSSNLHVRLASVEEEGVDTLQLLVGEEGVMQDRFGDWLFYFFEQPVAGHFKWTYKFVEGV